MLIGDVGYQTVEEINIGAARANYGWPNAEGPSSNPSYTDPAFSYPAPRHGRCRGRVRLSRDAVPEQLPGATSTPTMRSTGSSG